MIKMSILSKMKYWFILSMSICLEICNSGLASAQQNESATKQVTDTTYFIPPLEVVIDSALANNAMFRYYQQGAELKKYSLSNEKKSWTKNVGVQADVRYGTFDNFSTNTAEGQNPTIFATNTTQTNYGVGAYFKLPIADFLTRKDKVKQAKAEVEQAQTMAEVQRDQIRQMVIKQYNDLILKHSLLRIRARNLESSRTNMLLAEKEFRNGIISLGTYSGMSETAGNEEIAFEEAKTDFKTSYMLLEELAGFKFSLKNE